MLGPVRVSAKLPSEWSGPDRSTAPTTGRLAWAPADTPVLLKVPLRLVKEKPSTVVLASDAVKEKLPSDCTWPDRSTPFRMGKLTCAPTVPPLVSDTVADTLLSARPRTVTSSTMALGA